MKYKANPLRILLFVIILFYSCKKEHVVSANKDVPATAAQLAAVADSLSGGWGYVYGQAAFFNTSGIPDNSDFPVNASLVFGSSTNITGIDYSGKQTSIPYSLSGLNNTYYLNIQKNSDDNRKCKILKLTQDSLVLENKITGKDTSIKIIFVQRFLRAEPSEISQKQFKIVFNALRGGEFSVKIYITHLNGTEVLADTQDNTSSYAYLYTPQVGDHIRAAISSPIFNSLVQTLAFYKGMPYGDGWLYTNISDNYAQQWDIKN